MDSKVATGELPPSSSMTTLRNCFKALRQVAILLIDINLFWLASTWSDCQSWMGHMVHRPSRLTKPG